MITAPQDRLYWALWSKAKRQLMNGRETFTGAEENARRHEIHVRALGYDKSHKKLSNPEFTRVIRELKTIIDPKNAHSHANEAREADRRRKYFGLRGLMHRLRVGEEYVNEMSRRMFLGMEIGQLHSDELQKLIRELREHEDRQVA